MSSTSIMMSAGTWISVGESLNHSSDIWLKSLRRGKNAPYPETYAVLQFAIPSSLKYKKITSAKISYYARYWASDYYDYSSGDQGMEVAPFITDGQALYTLTGANIDAKGELGAWKTVEPFNGRLVSYPRTRIADVTELLVGNVSSDGYFTVFMAGLPGWYLGSSETRIGSLGTGHEAYLDIIYEDVTQLAPTPTYPVNANVNENQEILFSWAWNSSTEAVQASVQLEYKLKTAQNYTVVSLTQTGHTYKLTSGLAQGTYQWRIKGTNDASETSAYSSVVEFNVVGKPALPVINAVPNRALTEITWNAVGQLAADITLVDSNENILVEQTIASQSSSFKPEMFLKGTYTFGVRVRNETGINSDWAYRTFSITAAGPTKPSIRLFQNYAQVKINITRDEGINYALIRKEDVKNAPEKILAIISEDEYVDKTFALETLYRYIVRAYGTGGYTDSDPARAICHSETVIIESEDDEVILDRSESQFLPYVEDAATEFATFNTVGREYPIVEHGENETWAFRSNLFVTEEQKAKLRVMAKENKLFYRDYAKRCFPVAIEGLSFTRYMNYGYIAEIQFIRIAEEEVQVNV